MYRAGVTCSDCHDNERVQELNDTGEIVMSWWDDGESKVMHTTGVIPFVPDQFRSFLAGREIVETLSHKRKFDELAQAHGLPVPATETMSDPAGYQTHPALIDAINVALALAKPLLVTATR